MDDEYSIYIMRDATGRALYVGLSISPLARIGRHPIDKGWLAEVRRIDIIPGFSKEGARAEERRLITELDSKYNKIRNPNKIDQTLREENESLRAKLAAVEEKVGVSVDTFVDFDDEQDS